VHSTHSYCYNRSNVKTTTDVQSLAYRLRMQDRFCRSYYCLPVMPPHRIGMPACVDSMYDNEIIKKRGEGWRLWTWIGCYVNRIWVNCFDIGIVKLGSGSVHGVSPSEVYVCVCVCVVYRWKNTTSCVLLSHSGASIMPWVVSMRWDDVSYWRYRIISK